MSLRAHTQCPNAFATHAFDQGFTFMHDETYAQTIQSTAIHTHTDTHVFSNASISDRAAAAPPMTTVFRLLSCRLDLDKYASRLSHTVGTPAETVTWKRSIRLYTLSPSSHGPGQAQARKKELHTLTLNSASFRQHAFSRSCSQFSVHETAARKYAATNAHSPGSTSRAPTMGAANTRPHEFA